jgi:hypothetical protein
MGLILFFCICVELQVCVCVCVCSDVCLEIRGQFMELVLAFHLVEAGSLVSATELYTPD